MKVKSSTHSHGFIAWKQTEKEFSSSRRGKENMFYIFCQSLFDKGLTKVKFLCTVCSHLKHIMSKTSSYENTEQNIIATHLKS